MFGSEGPVPEGMSAEAALKNKNYSEIHDKIKANLIVLQINLKFKMVIRHRTGNLLILQDKPENK